MPSPEDQLLAAAKRAVRYLEAEVAGTRAGGDHELIFAGRELAAAIADVEAAQADAQLRERCLEQR